MYIKRVIIVLFVLFFSLSCTKEKIYTESKLMLGTQINLTILSNDNDIAAEAFDLAFKEISRIEFLMSPVKENSDVYKVNKYSYKTPIVVSDETFNLIKKSKIISKETEGAFDITFLTLGKLWNMKSKNFVLPSRKQIYSLLKYVDYRKVKTDDKYNSIKLYNKKVKISLGGIAKGYAIKEAIESLKKSGIKNAIVEAGGDLQVLGSKFGKPWKAGLVNPVSKDILLSIEMKPGECITTSGDYERFVTYKNKRYSHIIDPKTGYPAESFSSVTVICDDPVEADAYSTAFFVMGKLKTVEFLNSRRDLNVILIDRNMNIYASQDLRDKVTMLGDENILWF